MSYNGTSDAALRAAMRRVADGETEAFRLVAEVLEPRLTRMFSQMGVSWADCEDLFQESCLRIFRAAGSYDANRPFLPWALTVARRVMLNWLRARKPTVPLEEAGQVPDRRASPADGAGRDIWEFARQRLSGQEYELLWLRYGENLGPSEIASITRRTPVHVRVLLHRARHALATVLEKEGVMPKGGVKCELKNDG